MRSTVVINGRSLPNSGQILSPDGSVSVYVRLQRPTWAAWASLVWSEDHACLGVGESRCPRYHYDEERCWDPRRLGEGPTLDEAAERAARWICERLWPREGDPFEVVAEAGKRLVEEGVGVSAEEFRRRVGREGGDGQA
jgi:hypothetical protein